MPLIERTRSPTCSNPHLQSVLGKEGKGSRRQGRRRKETTPQPAMSYFYQTNLLEDTQSTDRSCRSGLKEMVIHSAMCVPGPGAPERSQGSKPLWFAQAQTYFTLKYNLYIFILFPATCREKKRNPSPPKSQYHGQDMRVTNCKDMSPPTLFNSTHLSPCACIHWKPN